MPSTIQVPSRPRAPRSIAYGAHVSQARVASPASHQSSLQAVSHRQWHADKPSLLHPVQSHSSSVYNSANLLPLATSPHPEQLAADQQQLAAFELFMPRHTGTRPIWDWLIFSFTVCLFVVAAAIVAAGLMCFIGDADGCAYLIAPLRARIDAGDADVKRWWRMLSTVVLSVGTVALVSSARTLCSAGLARRRNARLRGRIVDSMAGVTTRGDATRKIMSGMRSVMELVHDPALKVKLSFEGLTYRLRDGTTVLSDASGVIEADEVSVMMGPSGCGKSTLLSLLSGITSLNPNPDATRTLTLTRAVSRCLTLRSLPSATNTLAAPRPPQASPRPHLHSHPHPHLHSHPHCDGDPGKLTPHLGTICLNGKPGSVRELHKLIAFVPQDDVMLTTLTVMELLWFSACLRLPADTPRKQLNAWVHMVTWPLYSARTLARTLNTHAHSDWAAPQPPDAPPHPHEWHPPHTSCLPACGIHR